tara:strand:- start:78 stop:389 length:312 start_codon:yes stop_codon:yes gene_type:complete
MSDNEAPKDYSLAELESWLWDALENGCTPEEIHSSIKSTLLKSIKFHKSCYKSGKELFELINNSSYLEVVDDEWNTSSYPSLTHNPEDFKLDSPALHNDIDVE